jgi:hypothetical protein
MTDRPVFIIGAQRSGTTLLRLMLNAHTKIAIPEEGTFWMPLLRKSKRSPHRKLEGRELEKSLSYIENNSQFRFWGIDFKKIRREIDRRNRRCTLAELMSGFYSHYAQGEKKEVWGDKTPSFFRMIPILAKLFADARFVHIVRDGRDVYLSSRARNPSKRNVSVAALEWGYKVWMANRGLAALDPERFFELRYEDLVSEPEETLIGICSFLKLKYEPSLLEYWKTSHRFIGRHHSDLVFRPVSSESVGKWKKTLARRELRNFESIAGRTLASLGYELAGKTPLQKSVPLNVIIELAWGLPLRTAQVVRTAISLNIASRLGRSTDVAGRGRLPGI